MKKVMRRTLAVMLAVFMVLTLSACNINEPTTSAAPPQTTVTPTEAPTTAEPTTEAPTEAPTTAEPTTEAPTEAPTTAEPTTEAPTEAPTTAEPTTEAPTEPPTEAPTEPEKPVFRPGLYVYKTDWNKLENNDLGSSLFYFSETGQLSADFSYKDAGGSTASYMYGSYVVEDDTVYVYYWFWGGSGGPGASACMYETDELKIADEQTLVSTTVDKKTVTYTFSDDKEETMREHFETIVGAVNNKYISNDRSHEDPDVPEQEKVVELYSFPGQKGRTLASAQLGLYKDGRFCISTSFNDGAGGGRIIGNYVKDGEHIRCYVWFSQAGDPVLYATEGSVYDFWIMDDGKLLLQNLVDTYYLYFEKVEDPAKLSSYAFEYDIRFLIQYGFLDYTPKS